MESSSNASKEKSKYNENVESNPFIGKIKSKYILSKICENITKKQKLEIVKYNKKIQNRLNLDIKDYKEYFEKYTPIEIEIIPIEDEYCHFININENDGIYYHIYFNDNKEEIKNKYEIKEEDKVTKIKIIIDYQVKSFENLFFWCKCIKSINFKKFKRNNINNMSFMFAGCSSLKEINLNNFNTNKVNNMRFMFHGCSSLKEINLSNFITDNVTNMSGMFNECSSLKEINLSNFNTDNITNMKSMFYGCSRDLHKKIISENKNIKKEAFYDIVRCYNHDSDDLLG